MVFANIEYLFLLLLLIPYIVWYILKQKKSEATLQISDARVLYTSQFRVNHNTSAVFANDYFLTRADIQLSLGRNLVKATTTCVTLHIHNTQSVTRVLADTFERLYSASDSSISAPLIIS